ncbi:ferritin family protein [Candidatus Neomarinimicrobiota bacterium]
MDKPDFDSMTYEQIIAFCISLEKEAVEFYQSLAEKSKDEGSKARYLELAQMEQGHIRKLEGLDEETFFETTPKKIIDLKTTDYLVEIEPGKHLTTQEVLILAAKREKATRDLYELLAEKYAEEPFLEQFFTMMAEEEARHKHDLEQEYEKGILGEF